ncbi:MAG: tetratricopeptide repeat protein, partial [Candidatus Adiutrix sp.]|nr:tetratricopeptide repeat protein [Candidatus Adiutrix sp.]
MTQTAPQKYRSPAPVYLVLAALFCCALFPGRAAGQRENSLEQVALGDGQGYSRLAFTFREPLGPYTVKTEPGGRLLIDLGPMRMGELGALPRHEVITGLDFETRDGRLLALVRVGLAEYDLKHITGRDRYTLNLDVMPPAAPEAPAMPGQLGRETMALPSLAEVALEQSGLTPPGPHDGPAEHLFQRILGSVAIDNRSPARDDLNFLFETFPNHPRLEVASYLKAELDFLAGPPEETYAAATEAWKSFLDRWPHSALSSRARYKLAEADLLLNFNNEAAGQFAFLAGEGDDVYSQRALLKAADLLMGMDLVDEARKVLTPALNQGVADRLGWEVYARAGAADFYQGFHSQAAEILNEALRQVPDLHETFPESLYALGEAYHYLGRPDLSRHYLTQAVNLIPDHPKADIILTRIGDNYRQEGLDREAIAIYGAVRRNYPRQEGGLISQVHLADMGSLHSFFSQEKVFEALERGSRQATVEMYKSILDAGFTSPLVQLAQLRIGTALAEDGAANEAIKWLRELEINNPKSPLLPEALPVLNSALVDEMALFRDMEDWQSIVDLYADNSYYFASSDRPRMEALVAQAYERLGRFREAREMWAELAEETPDKRLTRARGLVVNSLKIGQPQAAFKYIQEMESEFPEQRRWLDDQLVLVGHALARPHNAEAVTNLLDLRRGTSSEPVRRDALSDAITIEIDGRRYDRAVTLIKQYRQEYPLDELSPEYLLTLAQIADYQKRPEQAWDLFSQFRQSYPEDPRGRQILLAQIVKADSLGRPEDAFRFIALYRGLYPRDSEGGSLLIEKMNRLWEAGRYDEAWEALVSFNREYPDDPRRPLVMMNYAERDWEKGRLPEARELLGELLSGFRAQPELMDLLLKLADRSWTRERYNEARDLTSLILASYPGDQRLADLLFRLADRSWTRERPDEARELTSLILANYPGDERLVDLLLKQADRSWTRERYDEAR